PLAGRPEGAARPLDVYFGSAVFVEGNKISFFEEQQWLILKLALESADATRLRACPACGKFYYAIPKNTGACRQHLGLERVRRTRAKKHKYNKSRAFRRRTGLEAVRGRERSELLALQALLSRFNEAADPALIAKGREVLQRLITDE